MKVLVVHNSYQQFGGEDSVVQLESELLNRHGNLAILHQVSNDRIRGFFGKLSAAIGTIFSISSYRSVRKLVRDLQPDIVHVHNFFPLISPSVFFACRAEGVPVVFTVHNYRLVCPTALLMHDGAITERSLHEGPWWALRHRVYRNSFVGTLFLCLMIWLHKRIGTWHNQVDRLIVLSQFASKRFEAAGFPAGKMVVKPNCVDFEAAPETERSGLLFVGRLSAEKGLQVLLSAFQIIRNSGASIPIHVKLAGDGPLSSVIEQSGLTWIGPLPSEQVRAQMQSASVLLLPSVWYEGFPMVLVEAYACGLPVIASRIGALAELVDHGVTGLLFEAGNADDLASKMLWASEHPEEMRRMGRAARSRYEERYTFERNYEQLINIYSEAITHVCGSTAKSTAK